MLTRAQVLSGEYDAFFHGQRMDLAPPALYRDVERDDTGGIAYLVDGSWYSWHYTWMRQSGPNWQPFRISQEQL